MQTRFII